MDADSAAIARVNGNSPYEDVVGYSRAVRAGSLVFLSGTTGTGDDGRIVDPTDAGAQTRQILRNLARALDAAGSGLHRVLALTIHVTDASEFLPLVAPALREAFGDARPTMTLVEVPRLIDPEMRVEISGIALARADSLR